MANNIDEEETLKKLEELKKEAKEGAKNRNRVNFLYNDNMFITVLFNNDFSKRSFSTSKERIHYMHIEKLKSLIMDRFPHPLLMLCKGIKKSSF